MSALVTLADIHLHFALGVLVSITFCVYLSEICQMAFCFKNLSDIKFW